MKQIVFGIACFGIIILTAVGILTLEQRSIRENEMDDALKDTVQSVLDSMIQSGKYAIDDDEELIAAFHRSLLAKLNAGTMRDGAWIADENFCVVVDVTGIDVRKGLLSVRVEETFTHPNGSIGTVVCDATAVFEQKEPPKMHTVTFISDGQIHMQYRIAEGSRFIVPGNPTADGRKFDGWVEEGTAAKARFPSTVFEDRSYVAVFQ